MDVAASRQTPPAFAEPFSHDGVTGENPYPAGEDLAGRAKASLSDLTWAHGLPLVPCHPLVSTPLITPLCHPLFSQTRPHLPSAGQGRRSDGQAPGTPSRGAAATQSPRYESTPLPPTQPPHGCVLHSIMYGHIPYFIRAYSLLDTGIILAFITMLCAGAARGLHRRGHSSGRPWYWSTVLYHMQ